ncbi:hypothetical protein PZA11_001891 [Diplocarpon coronariae]|nr:hypothetical protein JHW43_004236 [Diplocarpon mali]
MDPSSVSIDIDADSIDQVIQSVYPHDQTLSHKRSLNMTSPISSTRVSLRDHPGDPELPTLRTAANGESRRGSAGGDLAHSKSTGEDESGNASRDGISNGSEGSGMAEFFSAEVFQMVLHNPTTAHRFLRFAQSRACEENLEFLQKVDRYNRLLDEVTQTLSSIHATYTSPNAPRQVDINNSHVRNVSADVKQATNFTLPALEGIFARAQGHVEKLLASDIYPRFVRHQIITQASLALSEHKDRFQGLGDCFCLTDPTVADNPIRFASDGFVSVTGYSRKEIIPRNCRFLQGDRTDRSTVRRLRASIDTCEESVELLLNYRKNGDPFWNLLYVAPLVNEKGEVCLFLGGQINCSTTIKSCSDVLRVLSANDDELDSLDELAACKGKPPSVRSRDGKRKGLRPKSAFFKNWRKYNASGLSAANMLSIRDEAGMEGELTNRAERLSFKSQIEAFYTAYSKYLIMTWDATANMLAVQFYSPGVIDMLGLNLPNGSVAHIYNRDIFKVLSEFSTSSSSSVNRTFKQTVKDALKLGEAISVETGLLTGFEETRRRGLFGDREGGLRRVVERYITHWTPLKDQDGRVKWVVLTIAPKA